MLAKENSGETRRRAIASVGVSLFLWFAWPAGVVGQNSASRQSLRMGGTVGAYVSLAPTQSVRSGLHSDAILKAVSSSELQTVLFDHGHSGPMVVELAFDLRSNTPFSLNCQINEEEERPNLTVVVAQARASGSRVSSRWSKGETGLLADAFSAEIPITRTSRTIFSGPRISLSGGNESPDNSLRVVVTIKCSSSHSESQVTGLRFQALPEK